MDIIRRRNNSRETRRLVEQRYALSRPGTLRRRYDHQTQRTLFAPSRSNEKDLEQENNKTEEDSIIMRGDNIPIVD